MTRYVLWCASALATIIIVAGELVLAAMAFATPVDDPHYMRLVEWMFSCAFAGTVTATAWLIATLQSDKYGPED